MSSVLNPGAVTLTLRNWLLTVCHGVDSGSDVTTVRPDKITSAKPTVNLFLYQVEQNAAFGGFDLATRRSDGSLAKKPVVAVNLSYLVSFAASTEVASNKLMGAVVLAIHAHPGLSRSQIAATIAGEPTITGATLDVQTEAVKLSMPPISLDELSKIWGMFHGSEYWLSMHLLVTTVILESDFDPEPALPVRRFKPTAIAGLGPSIDSVASKGHHAGEPIETGATLVLTGNVLLQTGLVVLLDSGETIAPTKSTTVPDAIEAVLPAGVRAGIRQLRAEITGGSHTFSSNTVPFILRPKLSPPAILPGKKLKLTFAPAVTAGQKAFALLSLVSGGGADQRRIELPAAGRPYTTATIDYSALPAGDYIVRLRVDEAESLLAFSDVAPTISPVVTL